MLDAFRKLCADVDRATTNLIHAEECAPHYQQVLDYIHAHPEEHDAIARLLARHVAVGYEPGGIRSDLSLVTFLMRSLQWPEIKAAAQKRCDDGGNASDAHTMKSLLAVYDRA